MANEDYLKKAGVPVLWNADGKIKDIEKLAWLDTAFPDVNDKDAFIRRMHDLENRRTYAGGQRESMMKYVGELLNNPNIPIDFKESLKITNDNLTKINGYLDKEGLAKYVKEHKKDKDLIAAARERYKTTQYYNGRPENAVVRFADYIDKKSRILGKHKEKPTIIRSTSPDYPDKFSGKNALLNAFNKIGREGVEGTVGVGTDILRKFGGAPLEHLKSTAGLTGPLAVSLLTSAFINNPYIDKKVNAARTLLNPSQVYAKPIPQDNNVNALINRYPTFTKAFLEQRIADPRVNDGSNEVVTLQDIIDDDGGTPYLNRFKEDVYPLLQSVDNVLASRGYSEAERDQFLPAMSSEFIENYLNKNIIGLSSFDEQQAALEGYLNNKGLDDETREAYQKLLNDYLSHFDSKKRLAPPLFMQKGENDYDITPYMQSLINYTDADNDAGSAFKGGFGQGSTAGGIAGGLAGFALGNKGKKLKNAAAKALEGFFVGGTAAGALDAGRAWTFDEDILSKALPKASQAPALSSFFVNLGDFSDNSLSSVDNNSRLKFWQDQTNWQAPQYKNNSNNNNSLINLDLSDRDSWK